MFRLGWVILSTTLNDTGLTFENQSRIWISFYLVNLEVTIVSTSLIAMTDELKGFDKTGWITTAFLSTFTGTLCLPI